jgi:hypothetical protein
LSLVQKGNLLAVLHSNLHPLVIVWHRGVLTGADGSYSQHGRVMTKKKQDVKRSGRPPRVPSANRSLNGSGQAKTHRSDGSRELGSTRASLRNTTERLHFQASLRRHLSRVAEVEAIFARLDEKNVCRVFSVVHEHKTQTYVKIMRAERYIQNEFPELQFDFRIRAHQGRNPQEAVPIAARAVFLR